MCFTETIVCYAAGDVVAGLSKYSMIIKNVTGARGIFVFIVHASR